MNELRPTEFGLDLSTLRQLMTSDRGAIISHQVGRNLLHSIPFWGRTDLDEIRSLLGGLIEELQSRLEEEGITVEDHDPSTRLPKRLRDEASWLAALYTFYIPHVETIEERLPLTDLGLQWASLANDHLQSAILHFERSWWNLELHHWEQQITDLRNGIAEAVLADHTTMQLELRSRLTEWLIWRRRLDEAKQEAEELEEMTQKLQEGPVRDFHHGIALSHLGKVAINQGEYVEGLRLLEKSLELVNEERDVRNYSLILYTIANTLHGLGNSAVAIERLLEMAEAGKRANREVIATNAFTRIAEIYLTLNDPEGCRNAIELAERYIDNAHLILARFGLQQMKLALCLERGEIEEGIALAEKLLASGTDPIMNERTLQLLGQLYEKSGELSLAEETFRKGERLVKSSPASSLSPSSLSLARLLLQRGRIDEAEGFLSPLPEKLPESRTGQRHFIEALSLLSQIARERGDYPRAIEWLEQRGDARSQFEKEQTEESNRNARILADLRIRQQEDELEEARRQKAEHELAAVLTGLEVTHGRAQKLEKHLRTNLEWLPPEQMERVIESLRRSLTDPEATQRVDTLLSESDALLKLHGVDETFFEALLARWPDLTQKQQQLCGMIRAGLDVAQITHLLGITSNSLWTQRKRLRKKLGLEKEVVLDDLLAEL